MSYDEVLVYLYEHLPYYQRKGTAAYKGSLDNTLALDQMFRHPHRNFRTIHIAGTNGKGSVSHMLAAILQKAGYKTGLYTSPHLKDFRERIKLNGEMVPEKFVVDFVERFLEMNKTIALEPSFFELTVLMAFDYFSEQKVDIAVIEVGLGGRLDSTNIITPELSVITNISLDHTALLGDSLGRIALEKAGIIKPSVPVIIGETHPQTAVIFEGKAAENRSKISFSDQLLKAEYSMNSIDQRQVFNIIDSSGILFENLRLDLLGKYQAKNVCTLLSAVFEMQERGWGIVTANIRDGLENVTGLTGLSGRWQIIGANPRIICDTAHNEGGMREVVAQLKQIPHKKLHFIIGMVNDKDITAVLALLPVEAVYYFTKASIPRAMAEHQLMQMATFFGLNGAAYEDVPTAFIEAKMYADKDDLIFVGGSTFVVAEVIPS
ncbi:MAG: bifunctional folylpolyglutamate synthase/dihydrofolate synthase [Prolixibacteraceae bacterium]|jgi:dihydrofolate synthase/folylpolyglutamate synthase|nr:bifunctional folylpolyglutamate synthase/dihydrofolate synthase [Prolixibacteraceae bacterium]